MKVSTKQMTAKQLQVYGARIRLAWFRKASELGSVKAACDFFGIARSEYYYWNSRWKKAGKTLVSLYDQKRTPHSSPRTLSAEVTELILCVRRETGYGKLALSAVLARDYGVTVSDKGVN